GDRPALALGVARTQLLVDGCATDPHNLLCRELAGRLHRHRIASLRIEAGVGSAELDQVLARLAGEPGRGHRPLGLSVTSPSDWPHVTLQPLGYDRLSLRGEGTGEEEGEEARSGGELLWLELARMALDGELQGPAGVEDAADVAAALSRRIADPEAAASVLAGLSRLAESVQSEPGEAAAELRARVSALISL